MHVYLCACPYFFNTRHPQEDTVKQHDEGEYGPPELRRERERESRKGISSLLHPVGSMHVHTRQAHEGPAWHRQAESKALLVAMFLHCTVRQNMNVKMTAQQTYKIGHSFLGSAI